MTEPQTLRLWRPAPRALWVLLSLYLLLALAYNLAFPPFEPSDEINHFRFVRFLIEERRLPVVQAGDLSEYHQPPLYYALGAALSWPFPADDLPDYYNRTNPYRGFRYSEPGVDNKNLFLHGPWDRWPFQGTALSLHVARLVSLLTGVATVLLTYQTARALGDTCPGRWCRGERAALAAAGLVAFNPMFLAVSGSLQNDAGAAAGGAAVLWLGVNLYRAGFTPRRAFALGLVLGIAALMKITAALLIFPVGLLMVAWGQANRQSLGRVAGGLVMLVLGAVASCGWWFARNLIVYGEPTSIDPILDAYGRQPLAQGVALWGQSVPYAWTTFWGRFGHGELVLPGWIYLTLAAISLLALIGLAFIFPRRDRSTRLLMTFLGAAGLIEFAGLLYYLSINPTGANGRYAFPALPAYMILLVLGLLGLVPDPARRRAPLVILTAMLAFAILTLGLYILPAYNPPPAIASLPADAYPLDITLGDVARLRGFQVSTAQARPGDRIHLTLYWQPLRRTELPYSVFVHLFDSEGALVTQRDTYPGLGRDSTLGWTPGQMFADRYPVVIPETAYAPTIAHWEAGLWQADTGERAFVLDPSGQPTAAAVSFGELTINPLPGPVPNPVDLNFGGVLRLKGYSLPARTLTPGRPFALTLHWQPVAEFSHPYMVFVHVVAADGSMWANNSFEVGGGEQTVLPVLAPDTPPGIYSLLLGVFDDTGGGQRRLKILADDDHELEDHVRLTGVRVTP